MESAAFKAKFSFSYTDTFAEALTIAKKATLLTDDKEFDALLGVTVFKLKYL